MPLDMHRATFWSTGSSLCLLAQYPFDLKGRGSLPASMLSTFFAVIRLTTIFSLSATHEHTWHFSGSLHGAAFLLLKSAAALLLPLRYLIMAPEFRTSCRNVATRGDAENCPFSILLYAMTTGVLSNI